MVGGFVGIVILLLVGIWLLCNYKECLERTKLCFNSTITMDLDATENTREVQRNRARAETDVQCQSTCRDSFHISSNRHTMNNSTERLPTYSEAIMRGTYV